jgi:hypothetical protein
VRICCMMDDNIAHGEHMFLCGKGNDFTAVYGSGQCPE